MTGKDPRAQRGGVVKTTPYAGSANMHVVRVQMNPPETGLSGAKAKRGTKVL